MGAITIRIVRRPEYSSGDEQHLRKEVQRVISKTLVVDFEYVEEIERTATGKFRAVVSLLDDATDH
jgi:hypothetical protein